MIWIFIFAEQRLSVPEWLVLKLHVIYITQVKDSECKHYRSFFFIFIELELKLNSTEQRSMSTHFNVLHYISLNIALYTKTNSGYFKLLCPSSFLLFNLHQNKYAYLQNAITWLEAMQFF